MAIDTAEKRRSISGITIPLLPGVTPNAAKDAEWRQQVAGCYSGIAFSAVVYRFAKGMFEYVAANYSPGASFFFEAVHRATAGRIYARLAAWEAPYDPLTLVAVAGSELSTTSATDVRQRTSITLTDGKVYRVQWGKAGSDAGVGEGAEVIVP